MFDALRRPVRALSFAFLAAACLAAPASAHEFEAGALKIEHPWVRLPPQNAPVAGGYLAIENRGDAADRLVSVQIPVAGSVEIHAMKVDDAGKMTMRPLPDGLEIPPGAEVALKPGSFHLMLMKLTRPLALGESLDGNLTFAKAGTVPVQFTVEPMGGPAPEHHEDAPDE